MTLLPASPAGRWGISTVFLDRDGTLNAKAPEGEYITRPSDFEFLPGARRGVRALTDAGLRVIVISNQRGIALGRMTEADLDAIHSRMLTGLRAAGAELEAVYHCPHEVDVCDCRKPRTGMLKRARQELGGIDFGRSVVIGDSPSDMQAGRALGCRLVMITEESTEVVDRVEPSLSRAASWLIGAG